MTQLLDSSAPLYSANATSMPPAPPKAPPATATAAPKPPRKRGWIIAVVIAVIVLVILGVVAWFGLHRWQQAQVISTFTPAQQTSAFASAMRKAGVKAPAAPASPVELTSVRPVGSHTFAATFTPDEITALLDAFSHSVQVGGTRLSIANARFQLVNGDPSLAGRISAGSTSYTGSATGMVTYGSGKVSAPEALQVEAEGLTLGGKQAAGATSLLLAYVNGYLRAAPGLKIDAAEVTPEGIHAAGVAPDSISW